MVNVTLKTVELRKLQIHNYIACDDILTNGDAIECAEKNDECALYWFPTSKEVVVSKRNFVSAKKAGAAFSNDFLASTSPNLAKVIAKAKETAFSLTESTCAEANSLGMKEHQRQYEFFLMTIVNCRIHFFDRNRRLF